MEKKMDLITPEVATLNKGGETQMIVELERRLPSRAHRGASGVKVTVKVHPLIEEFMHELGGGETVEVGGKGRHWIPLNSDAPFLAYDLHHPMESVKTSSGVIVNLENLGGPLSERLDRYESINLSFLRLVGASEGAGVGFLLRGVYGTEDLKKIRDQVKEALLQFYISYMRPLNLSVIVSSQER